MMKLIIGAAVLCGIAAAAYVLWRRSRPIKTDRFQTRWRELQQLCGSSEGWSEAVVAADKLLDEALKKRKIRGKTMGERMVKAQRIFTDNDGVWFGHKLRNKIEADSSMKLKENDVKAALIAIRQALKDLGALPK
jgi:hypothetical protein